MGATQAALAVGAVENWAQELDAEQAAQALIGFGLWSEADGVAPVENLDAAYSLAERTLGLSRQAIAFRAEGQALVCQFVYAERVVTASAHAQALALTRAVLRAAYEARLL